MNKTECDKEVCSVCYKGKKRIMSNVSVMYTCRALCFIIYLPHTHAHVCMRARTHARMHTHTHRV